MAWIIPNNHRLIAGHTTSILTVAGQDAAGGTPFGRYRLIELLGRGGMGEVWRAHDSVTDRVVAIKVLPANLSEDEDFQRRFRREAHAAARLNTPHVVPIYDYGEIDGRLFVSMRLIEGRDLQTVLADGPLDPARAVHIIDQVAKALHAAHKVGLMHRDIKPSNILLDDDDFAYLIDFGIARGADDTRLTKTGITIGTFAYIAPERLNPHTEEDARADIYSLACVLYEALTGEPPFPGTTTAHLIAAHLNTSPPRPSTTQPDVPSRFDGVIAKGMAKDPENRYATTVELADAARDAITVPLQPSVRSDNIAAPVPPPPPREAQPTPRRPDWRTSMSTPAPPRIGIEGFPTYQQRAVSSVDQTLPGQPLNPPFVAQHQLRQDPSPRRGIGRWRIAAVLIAIAAIAALGIVATVTWPKDRNTNAGNTTTTTTTTTSNTVAPKRPRAQIQIPFAGLKGPHGVAVDIAGDLFITDSGNNRVLKMPAGSTTQSELPFTGLGNPVGLAVNTHGDVFVADWNNRRVLELPAGSSAQVVLPITGLNVPIELAVNAAGDLFITDLANRVHVLRAGANSSTTLPITGLAYPHGIGVNQGGDVFVADSNNSRVVKLAAGSNIQTELPFNGLSGPVGLAVSSHDDVYVTDYNGRRVLELPARSDTQTVLPLTGLTTPAGTAVDASGDVFVTDSTNNWVLKLPAE